MFHEITTSAIKPDNSAKKMHWGPPVLNAKLEQDIALQ